MGVEDRNQVREGVKVMDGGGRKELITSSAHLLLVAGVLQY
jgi:hypothetical protein